MKKQRNEKPIDEELLMRMMAGEAAGTGEPGTGKGETAVPVEKAQEGKKLIYAIGAVVGLIGGVKVYGKFSSGAPDTSKTAASWFGACIFLIVAATILRSFFL